MTTAQFEPKRRRFGWPQAAALIGAGAIVGGIGAATLTASAATPSSYSSSASSTAAAQQAAPGNDRSSTPVRTDEKSVSAADAATLKAAALKAVPGGSVYRIETDAGDGTYEAHMTKADGTPVTVKFDKNLAVTKVEDGMGTGDPAPAGQPTQGG
jgi:hypothetical protein